MHIFKDSEPRRQRVCGFGNLGHTADVGTLFPGHWWYDLEVRGWGLENWALFWGLPSAVTQRCPSFVLQPFSLFLYCLSYQWLIDRLAVAVNTHDTRFTV